LDRVVGDDKIDEWVFGCGWNDESGDGVVLGIVLGVVWEGEGWYVWGGEKELNGKW